MSAKIQYGDYSIANVVGQVVGYSTEDDLKISEIGEVEEKVVDGETKMETYSNHGYSATGTLVLTDSQFGAKFGTVIQITNRAGETRPYVVQSWEEGVDTDTGAPVATFTANSRDSMISEYAIGPRDPETGEPLSGKARFLLGLSFDDLTRVPEFKGVTIGLFRAADWRDRQLWDFSKAVYTSTICGMQAEFIVDGSAEGLVVGANNGALKLRDEEGGDNPFGTGLYESRVIMVDDLTDE